MTADRYVFRIENYLCLGYGKKEKGGKKKSTASKMESRLNSHREMRSKENAGEDRKGERERERGGSRRKGRRAASRRRGRIQRKVVRFPDESKIIDNRREERAQEVDNRARWAKRRTGP